MSPLNRKTLSIGRAQRELRDDRVFVVAAEDTYAPEQYFKQLPLPRVKVIVIPTPANSGLSSPGHVVERLKQVFTAAKKSGDVQNGDEFWVCIDTDYHMNDNHIKGTLVALMNARQAGFELAISNPCFELWLLLHHADVAPGTVFAGGAAVEAKLKTILDGYNKTSIRAGMFPITRVSDAIRRARALEASPDNPAGRFVRSRSTISMTPGDVAARPK